MGHSGIDDTSRWPEVYAAKVYNWAMEQAEQRMQCMEVWGGNITVDTHVALSGLDVWIYCRPFGQAPSGGDVYYLSSCATGRISRILLADVSGHGSTVSTIAGDLRALMQRYVNYLDPTQFVRKLNQTFTATTDTRLFATAVVASFFATNNHLSLNNAGHPAPLHYDAVKKQWRLVESHSPGLMDMPLGITEQSAYSQNELPLGDNDLVLAYTDALIEARDAAGEMMSPKSLLGIVGQLSPEDPVVFMKELLERIARMHPGNLEGDDVTVLVMRPTGELKHLPLARKLAAPFRFAASTIRSIARGEPVAWPQWSKATSGGYFFDALGRGWRGCACGKRVRHD